MQLNPLFLGSGSKHMLHLQHVFSGRKSLGSTEFMCPLLRVSTEVCPRLWDYSICLFVCLSVCFVFVECPQLGKLYPLHYYKLLHDIKSMLLNRQWMVQFCVTFERLMLTRQVSQTEDSSKTSLETIVAAPHMLHINIKTVPGNYIQW